MGKFYVYEHWRPDKDICFYVGKGKGNRAYHMRRDNPHHTRIVHKLKRLGMCVEIRLVHEGLNEQIAFELEKSRIAFWRSLMVELCNLTDGGEGISGYRHTDETKQINRNMSSGRKQSEETKQNKNAKLIGRKRTEETKARIRLAANTPENREKRRVRMLGNQITKGRTNDWATSIDNVTRLKALANTVENKERLQKNWADPTIREKMLRGIKIGQQRRRARERGEII